MQYKTTQYQAAKTHTRQVNAKQHKSIRFNTTSGQDNTHTRQYHTRQHDRIQDNTSHDKTRHDQHTNNPTQYKTITKQYKIIEAWQEQYGLSQYNYKTR